MTRTHVPVPGGRHSTRALESSLRNLARSRAADRQRYLDRLETYRELAGQGEHPELIARRMDVCLRTVERYRAATR